MRAQEAKIVNECLRFIMSWLSVYATMGSGNSTGRRSRSKQDFDMPLSALVIGDPKRSGASLSE